MVLLLHQCSHHHGETHHHLSHLVLWVHGCRSAFIGSVSPWIVISKIQLCRWLINSGEIYRLRSHQNHDKEMIYVMHNEVSPNSKIFMGGTNVFTSRHYDMHMARVGIAFIYLVYFLNDFVFLSFMIINQLWCGSCHFGLCHIL